MTFSLFSTMSVGCEIFFACSSVCVQLARKNWPCFLHVGLSLKHRTSTANQHSRHFLSLPRPERSCVQVPQLVGRQWCRLQSTIRSLRTYKYILFLFFCTLHTYTGVQISLACMRASLLFALSKPTSVAYFVRRRR